MNGNLSNFLENLKTAIFSEENFREDICLVIEKEAGFRPDRSLVEIRSKTIRINTDPYVKSEIFIHKEKILVAIKDRHPKKNILDII